MGLQCSYRVIKSSLAIATLGSGGALAHAPSWTMIAYKGGRIGESGLVGSEERCCC
jgi:hypothetical protein